MGNQDQCYLKHLSVWIVINFSIQRFTLRFRCQFNDEALRFIEKTNFLSSPNYSTMIY